MSTKIKASEITRLIESAWRSLQGHLRDLPDVVVVVFPAGRPRAAGHFAAACWRRRPSRTGTSEFGTSELGIHPGLFHSAHQVLEVLLHEAAHAILWSRGVRGTNGYYHLAEFRDVCVTEIGLRCDFRNTRYGWTDTSLAPDASDQYRDVRQILNRLRWEREQLTIGAHRQRSLPPSGYLTLRCECVPARKIRCTVRNLERGDIQCSACGSAFRSSSKAT